jgi:hypothetical protein
MTLTLAFTALLMGLAGGPHCVAMCGAACGGVAALDARSSGRGMALFQAGRLAGYSALGGLAAASVQGMGWLGTQVAALRPVWTLFHVAALVMGAMLLVHAQQPMWLQSAGKRLWTAARTHGPRGAAAPAAALLRPGRRGAGRQRGGRRGGDGPLCARQWPGAVSRSLGLAVAARQGPG